MISQFIKRVKKSCLWVWRQEGTPGQRARGIAVGVFSGCFPFFGLQSLVGICLASLFRANHLLAVAGTWISNPLTYFPLYWLNYRIGAFVLNEEVSKNGMIGISQKQIWDQGLLISTRILLGSSIVGLIAGIILGSLSYCLFKFFSKKKSIF